MYIYHTKHFTLGATFFIGISLVFGVLSLREKPAQAQHIDIFGKLGKESPNSYHQSFAPYGGTVPIPWIDEKPTPITIKVTETITYEIPVDEKKFNEKKLTIEDLELKEVTNNSEINFHQVDCHFFKVIKQTQTRTVENLSYKREREGTQYWLSDGKKYIEWGKWSTWSPEKEEQGVIDVVEKKP
ncbi:MAG: hypothetical protein L3J17_08060 [Candidatus Jettenia sp.]|nr:MAG: hypothetical protein L3J17_08060 [Candidatus Jettenia sp.]